MKDSCWFLRLKANFTQTVMLLVFSVVRLWDPRWGFEQLAEKFSGFHKPSMIHKGRVTFMYVQNEYDEETNLCQINSQQPDMEKHCHGNMDLNKRGTSDKTKMASAVLKEVINQNTDFNEETKHSQNHESRKTVARWNLVVWTSTKSTKLSHLLQWKSVDENKMMQMCLVCNQVWVLVLQSIHFFFVWPLSRPTILIWLAMRLVLKHEWRCGWAMWNYWL